MTFLKRKIKWIVLGIFLSVVFYTFLLSIIEKGQESEVAITLRAYQMAMLSYHESYKTFVIGQENIGYEHAPKNGAVYFSKESISIKDLEKLKEDELPFQDKEKFQILCIVHKSDDEKVIWIATDRVSSKKIRKI